MKNLKLVLMAFAVLSFSVFYSCGGNATTEEAAPADDATTEVAIDEAVEEPVAEEAVEESTDTTAVETEEATTEEAATPAEGEKKCGEGK